MRATRKKVCRRRSEASFERYEGRTIRRRRDKRCQKTASTCSVYSRGESGTGIRYWLGGLVRWGRSTSAHLDAWSSSLCSRLCTPSGGGTSLQLFSVLVRGLHRFRSCALCGRRCLCLLPGRRTSRQPGVGLPRQHAQSARSVLGIAAPGPELSHSGGHRPRMRP